MTISSLKKFSLSSILKNRNGLYGKHTLDSFKQTGEDNSEKSLGALLPSGTAFRGEFLTHHYSGAPSNPISLSWFAVLTSGSRLAVSYLKKSQALELLSSKAKQGRAASYRLFRKIKELSS